MEDDQELQKEMKTELHHRLAKVSPDLLSEFLFKRGVEVFKCLLCGSEDIGIPQCHVLTSDPDDDAFSTFVDYIKVDSDDPPYSLMNYQYRIICRNCGFTHHLAVWPVLKWVEAEMPNEQ